MSWNATATRWRLALPAPEPDPSDAVIAAQGLHVSLGGVGVLHDISLALAAGETLAVLGPNGSGKSTLVRTLLGVVPRASGTVELFGQPLGRRTPWHRIGYVPQRVTAAGGVAASAREVVTSGLLNQRRLTPGRRARERALEALDLMGIADRADDAVGTLSGGQQQRVLIARALARHPDLLVLDEPMAGVDLASQEALADALAVMKQAGASVVLVVHETGALTSLIDRAIVLDRGCKTHDGPAPSAHGAHALPGHDHVHPHPAEPSPLPANAPRDFRAAP